MAKRSSVSKLLLADLLFNNPLPIIIALVIGLPVTILLGIFIGGVALETIVGLFLNLFLWSAVIFLVIFLELFNVKPDSRIIIIFSIVIGGAFWIASILPDIQAAGQFWLCQIPIIGGLTCGFAAAVSFVPRIFLLGLYILTTFAMIYVFEFIRLITIRSGGNRG